MKYFFLTFSSSWIFMILIPYINLLGGGRIWPVTVILFYQIKSSWTQAKNIMTSTLSYKLFISKRKNNSKIRYLNQLILKESIGQCAKRNTWLF